MESPARYARICHLPGMAVTRAVKLTAPAVVGIVANVKAELVTKFKDVTGDGGLIEMTIWRLPEPVSPSDHGFKYRLVFVIDGRRVIGFDNERGKGDHCHIEGEERPYNFTDLDMLVEDFIAEVERWRNAR